MQVSIETHSTSQLEDSRLALQLQMCHSPLSVEGLSVPVAERWMFWLMKRCGFLQTEPGILQCIISKSFWPGLSKLETDQNLAVKCVCLLHAVCPYSSLILHKFYSSTNIMRSALFIDITQRRVVILYRRFGRTHWSHLKRSWNSWPFKMGPIRCPETSVWNYHSALRTIQQERTCSLHLDGSLSHA